MIPVSAAFTAVDGDRWFPGTFFFEQWALEGRREPCCFGGVPRVLAQQDVCGGFRWRVGAEVGQAGFCRELSGVCMESIACQRDLGAGWSNLLRRIATKRLYSSLTLEEADAPSLKQEQAPNPLAEKAREELAQKRNRLERRESGTVLEDKSKGFAGFPPKNAAGEGDAAADGDGAAPQGAFLL